VGTTRAADTRNDRTGIAFVARIRGTREKTPARISAPAPVERVSGII